MISLGIATVAALVFEDAPLRRTTPTNMEKTTGYAVSSSGK